MSAVTELREETISFQAGDGLPANLVHVRGQAAPTRGPVLLVHGAGVRGNIFRAPVAANLVDVLIANGYDVWLENWRASIDLPPNRWDLDQAAVFDHPEAVRTVVARTGAERVQAIIHCQGSTSFMMASVAGLVPQVRTIISNAVALHPVVPAWSGFKLACLLPVVRLLTDHLDPHWGEKAPRGFPRLIDIAVKLVHRECDNGVCKHVSFTYGAGFPALWRHENLNSATHDWLKQEFGFVPLTFFEQMRECVRAGRLVSTGRLPELPRDFTASPPRTDARFIFLAGLRNRCFLPASQERTHEYFLGQRVRASTLYRFPGYSHLDVFLGSRANEDIFPVILEELGRD